MPGRATSTLRSRANRAGILTPRPLRAHLPRPAPGTDIWAIINKYVSVSPLQANFTDHHVIDALGERFNAAWGE